MRVPRLVEQHTEGNLEKAGIYRWEWCESLQVLLLAYDEQWFENWPALIEVVLADNGAEHVARCSRELGWSLRGSNQLRGTLAMIDLLDQIEADSSRYDSLIRSALNGDFDDFEARRVVLLERLDGNPAWNNLSERSRDWLTGKVDPRAASLSCSAPEDWDPELLSDDDWGDYDEVNSGDD